MFKLAFVLIFSCQALARPNPTFGIDPFVVGGTPVAEGQFPFIVTLRNMSNFAFCGGALVSNRHVVTAAHCLSRKTADMIQIGVGSVELKKQKLYPLEKLVINRDYECFKYTNDIAILTLKTPLTLGGNVQTIAYPTNDNLEGKNVTAMGWGRTSNKGPFSEKLLSLNKPIINSENCSKSLGSNIGPGQICFGSDHSGGMCFGDSGSPLAYKGADGKNYFAGIVSWGVPCAAGFPDVFTRVSYYAKWITDNMK